MPCLRYMAETDWQEGRGLKNGRPDPDYAGAHIEVFLDYANLWVCKIRWGTTWGHLAFGKSATAVMAMGEAVEQASLNGCPDEWLPRVSF